MFPYFSASDSEQYAFYRIPKELISNPIFKKLSTDAKLLYGLMLDRMSLSVKNEWVDRNGNVYIYFTLDEIKLNLCCGTDKAVSMLAELDSKKGIGLIERKKQGQGKPTMIFVKNFIQCYQTTENQKSETVQTWENQKSAPRVSSNQDLGKTDCNNTESINPDISDTNLSSPSTPSSHKEDEGGSDVLKTVKENIDYGIMVKHNPSCKQLLDELVSIMVDVLTSTKDRIHVDGEYRPTEIVKQRLLSLDSSHMEYIQESLAENTTQVKSIKPYLLTCLWRAPETINHWYMTQVNHDLNAVIVKNRGG